MDTTDITLVRTISEQGSLTRAAELLHMSQPTLSKKLARLETQLNAKLFSRSATGVVATEVAHYIIASSQPIQAQLKRIERHVEQLTQHESGEVRLGVGPIIEQVLLPEVLARFVAATGEVQLSIITEHADTLLAGLYDADLDVIAGPFSAADHADLVGFPLIQDDLVTVARAAHPIFAAGQSTDMASFPFASPAPQGTVSGGRGRRAPTGKQIASENYPLLKNLTLNSDSICRGPWYVFRDELESGALREIKARRPVRWQSACLVRPESIETPLVKLLVNLLVDGSRNYVRR
jgi:LysR family transcriptional regulator, regulator of abg operon